MTRTLTSCRTELASVEFRGWPRGSIDGRACGRRQVSYENGGPRHPVLDSRFAPLDQRGAHKLAPMAAGAVMYNFAVQLADVDRGVYEDVALQAARHPSETDAYMMTRVLAYCLEYAEGITFSDGISSTDEPAVLVRDLTGRLTTWIEVGAPMRAALRQQAGRPHDGLHASRSGEGDRMPRHLLEELRDYQGGDPGDGRPDEDHDSCAYRPLSGPVELERRNEP